MAEALLGGGDDPNEVDGSGTNASHEAACTGCRLPLFHRILAAIHNVQHACDEVEDTALMSATSFSRLDIGTALMHPPGIDVHVQGGHNRTALHWAVHNNRLVAQLLRDDRVDISLKED